MAEEGDRNPRVLAIDAGGTMTDTFIVDEAGSFVVGKAQTTPEDESVGFMASARDALEQWGSHARGGIPRDRLGHLLAAPRCSTGCSRAPGLEIGCIVSAGQEDYLRIERGIQTYLGYSYSDRLHLATHFHNEPLVPRERMKGVRGRIDVLRRRGPAAARSRTCARRPARCSTTACEGIVVSLLFSYRNPDHELRVAEILEEEKARARGSTARCRSSSPPSSTRCAATCRGSTRR